MMASMSRKVQIVIEHEFKACLELEAWQQHMTLSEYVRGLLERSRTPDGKLRHVAAMRKRGRPRRDRE